MLLRPIIANRLIMPTVLFVMSDYGHDPTETAIPYRTFKNAGWDLEFATESGAVPHCDKLMLTGWTQKILGATQDTCIAYAEMMNDLTTNPAKAWSSDQFSFMPYDILMFPGGHEKSVRQVIESARVHSLLAEFWIHTLTSSSVNKAVAAICHGVLVPSLAKDANGLSLLFDCSTTTLPNFFENAAYYGTAMLLGDYYKTFGSTSANCEEMVKVGLRDPKTQFLSSNMLSPFVVVDAKRRYVSGRYPADAELLAKTVIDMWKGK